MMIGPRVSTGAIPKYRQLLNILREQIISGQLMPGQRLPTEDELITAYGLSRGTVRKAVEQLEAERLIHTEHGVGSFVASVHDSAIPFHFGEPESTLGRLDRADRYEVLEQKVIPASLDIAEKLKIPIGEPVIHVARRRARGGRVIGYSERYLPESLCPGLVDQDLSGQSVHELLVTSSMLPLLRAEFQIEAHATSPEEAALLLAEQGVPAIVVIRLTYTAPNRPAVWYYGLFLERYAIDIRLGEPGLGD